MLCLVTGAGGFVGSHLCERLLANGCRRVRGPATPSFRSIPRARSRKPISLSVTAIRHFRFTRSIFVPMQLEALVADVRRLCFISRRCRATAEKLERLRFVQKAATFMARIGSSKRSAGPRACAALSMRPRPRFMAGSRPAMNQCRRSPFPPTASPSSPPSTSVTPTPPNRACRSSCCGIFLGVQVRGNGPIWAIIASSDALPLTGAANHGFRRGSPGAWRQHLRQRLRGRHGRRVQCPGGRESTASAAARTASVWGHCSQAGKVDRPHRGDTPRTGAARRSAFHLRRYGKNHTSP